MEVHCSFWLPKKNRFCANAPFRDSSFCGNHTKRSDGQWIPCPIDSSHSVLEENLDSHLKKCPLLKQTQSLSVQPFYQKGINSGKQDEDEKTEGEEETTQIPSGVEDLNFTSEMKRNAVYSMDVPKFFQLIRKIKSLHASACNDIQESFKISQACGIWTNRQVDRKLPFQEKHVLQQASILGNLEDLGVIRSFVVNELKQEHDCGEALMDDNAAVVEFGAGRGYLTQVLVDCYGIKKVLLVERKSYKLKADRSLRQKESVRVERLRIDIEDLNLRAIESLQGTPYLAIGKHLCGPATDMTLRCCIPQQYHQNIATHPSAGCFLRGLAVATCCHHLCQWKHYINKRYMSNFGITKEDFHAITWFTSWAVDADHGSDITCTDYNLHTQILEEEETILGSNKNEVGDIIRNMKAIDRALLGFMCKDIIDAGRLMWMKERGLVSRLVKYVPCSISPENHLLIARP